ncbi:CapA family protein [Actinacidiphila guanduensis]|uniref:Poly-gamma-glutamate synthesis protein (Capsule biosynthesis protein) n=1 Tax=Actinacidiphila guanduensis TaxID=310781 RepID=A0A1G9ZPU1_9ACTN|nr:CapA family protein [Actinacidiphila guanduensis]SDN23214.1 poly-gamma-glutamate synthesis protein (capsule biosynthesis protein) [Actinacidiphila guanduensis]
MLDGSDRRAPRRTRTRTRRRGAAALTATCLLLAATGASDRLAARPGHRAGAAEGPAAAARRAPGTITLAFAGDVHFAGRTAARLGLDPALGPVSAHLAAADFAMVNLESAITTRGTPQPKTYHFRTTPAALTALRDSGVDAVTMANNHAVDYGAEGLADTVAAARAARIPVLGIGADAAQAYRPYTATIGGVRLALLAASQIDDITNADFRAGPATAGIASALDRPRLLAAVRAARAHADAVVVYLHWGTEGESCPTAEQTSLAADLAAAGAAAVVGTHAHVVLGSGMLGRTFVAYGLGNFLWYGTSPYPHSDETGVTTLTLDRAGRVTGAGFSPALVGSQGLPEPQTGREGVEITRRQAELRGCTGLAAPPAG